ncbi:hypothetical protein, partial [Salmonella sp. s51228]|uniref:hypothetical protein n=1 Tax=Salmonella sp. s51228 TaxID=3159652 RepID=UPI003980FE49
MHFVEYCNRSVRIYLNFAHIPFDVPVRYHVHLYPVNSQRPSSNQCGSDLTGGHHDPTGRKTLYGARYSSMCSSDRNNCERGDLSGKFGKIGNGTATYWDDKLSLTGIYGILYRSIVIHDTNGSRYICATIEPYTDAESRGRIITAAARFYGP